jgi:hypothetical protein
MQIGRRSNGPSSAPRSVMSWRMNYPPSQKDPFADLERDKNLPSLAHQTPFRPVSSNGYCSENGACLCRQRPTSPNGRGYRCGRARGWGFELRHDSLRLEDTTLHQDRRHYRRRAMPCNEGPVGDAISRAGGSSEIASSSRLCRPVLRPRSGVGRIDHRPGRRTSHWRPVRGLESSLANPPLPACVGEARISPRTTPGRRTRRCRARRNQFRGHQQFRGHHTQFWSTTAAVPGTPYLMSHCGI